MLVFTRAVLASVVVLSPAFARDIPARTAGLWLLKAEDNPFVDWSMCIDEARNDFLDTDVWDNFENECNIPASSTRGSSGKIEATCKLSEKTDAKLRVTFSGDFKTGYISNRQPGSRTLSARQTRSKPTPGSPMPGNARMTSSRA